MNISQDQSTINGDRRMHPIYWFDDGSLILRLGPKDPYYKVHKSLLALQSPTLLDWIHEDPTNTSHLDSALMKELTSGNCALAPVPSSVSIRIEDLDALFAHIYHTRPMSSFSHFSVVAQICRASSPQQINCPDIHQLSRKYIEQMFPSGPRPFSHPDCLEEALELATEYNLPIQKGILYSLVTTSNFDTETDEVAGNATIPADGPTVAPPISLGHSLSPSDAQRCQRLMKNMMDHFTPILFTVGTTSHMACTDVLADTWMPLVIQPALANDGVYKPLETLQSIIDIDWAKHGLCELCIIEKRAEWQGEQEDIWERMNGWVD